MIEKQQNEKKDKLTRARKYEQEKQFKKFMIETKIGL